MADRLVDFAANPAARRWVSRLGLPVPMPPTLVRPEGPWVERPLADRRVTLALSGSEELATVLADSLARAGADPALVEGTHLAVFQDAGEAWGRPPRVLGEEEDDRRAHALIFDATGLSAPDQLAGLHAFFQPRLKTMARNGRCLVLGRPAEKLTDPVLAATQRALEGFVRSLAKETGRKGTTTNLITVADGAEARLGPVLRFLLSDRSPFVTGQVLDLSKTVRPAEDVPVRALDGRVALVTGSARGIGRATAEQLAAEGAHVIVHDRPEDREAAEAVAASIGGSVFLVDVTDADAGARLAEHIQTVHGSLDVLVHNAGVTRDKTLGRMSRAQWDLPLDVNLLAVMGLTEALEPVLAKQARIVCLSSIAGLAGNVGQTNYAASKAGVAGYVQAAGRKYARRGIAVNAIAPGFIETRMTDAIPVATREVARRLGALSQGGLPWDIAQAVTFLASPGASALCGQTLRVCGGNFVGA